MNWDFHLGRTATLHHTSSRQEPTRLRALIDRATGDSIDESDEHAGLLSVFREEVACPFAARLGGDDVQCIRLECPRNGYGLNAVCNCKGKIRVVDIGLLEWVEPLPAGHQWIEAYFAWRDLLG